MSAASRIEEIPIARSLWAATLTVPKGTVFLTFLSKGEDFVLCTHSPATGDMEPRRIVLRATEPAVHERPDYKLVGVADGLRLYEFHGDAHVTP